MKLRQKLYSVYGFSMFALVFLALLPFFILFIQRKRWHRYTHTLNQLWAEIFLFLVGIPVKREFRAPIHKNTSYVFCANHFSWLDIVLMGLAPPYFVFIGKKSLAKAPLFGYMYSKLHILVDRHSAKSRYETYVRCKEAVEAGKSITMFAEGGIRTDHPPHMAPFKDGAFRVAIEQQIPLVPVTIPFNWKILPGKDKLYVTWHRAKIIFHEPIPTTGLTLDDVESLKNRVFDLIQEELLIQNRDEN
ncbi:MAG TPA: 1-acyl-sn-glycerol-3-phosphate acyltransferase [Cytophagales bacterium]|nr:1-acyl-sn-glycerol-3-phosphate acyltransferase [Cytophagales bacterium]HAP63310.1 1-acyl-sn-glycerol-3-phosphate acyltransferase [Cytophagales bacterium]